jgi:hypothetical protein
MPWRKLRCESSKENMMQTKTVQQAVPASDVASVCETLKRGLEARDAEVAASVYANDAEMVVVNRNYPPSHPMVRKGRSAVQELYRDVCSREMTHKITATVVGPNSFAMRESCLYPDGCRVVGHFIAELQDGKIIRQFNVDCWDE